MAALTRRDRQGHRLRVTTDAGVAFAVQSPGRGSAVLIGNGIGVTSPELARRPYPPSQLERR